MTISKPSTIVTAVVTGSRALLARHESAWRALALRVNAQPFLLPEWIGAYLEAFEPNARIRIVTVERDGELIGILPLVVERLTFYGVPVRRLRAPGILSCPDRFDILCSPENDALVASEIWNALNSKRDWDVLELVDLPEGGPGWQLHQLAAIAGNKTGHRISRRTPYLPINSTSNDLADLAPGTTAKFRANLRRRRTRLGDLGPIEVKRVTAFDDVYLQRFLELENSGWKGASQTSILSRERMNTYYRSLTASAAANGYLAMYTLEAGGEVIAMHLGLALAGRYFVPKLSYDERRHQFGPGHLLVSEVLADCAARGITEFEFLGDDTEWKRAWTDQVHVHYRAHVFNNTVAGRAAWLTRYRIGPGMKGVLRRTHPLAAPQPLTVPGESA
jgi:CelD/BcsL family acetyltransferase involved in cellulose biosynthesis